MTDPSALIRPGARLAVGFCLDSATLVTKLFDQDLVPCVVLLGVLQANVAADARARAGPSAEVTPFAALNRQPVSVYRLARNLSLPYETARRHAARLVESGICVRDGEGLAVAPEALFRAAANDISEDVWQVVLKLHADLRALGLRVPDYQADAGPDEKRRVARLTNTFLLSSLKLAVEATASDLVTALIYLGVQRANRANQDRQPGGPDAADPQRTAVSVYRLARLLRLPYETTRRHAAILVNEGLCHRLERGGLLITASMRESEHTAAAMVAGWTLLSDFATAAFGPMDTAAA